MCLIYTSVPFIRLVAGNLYDLDHIPIDSFVFQRAGAIRFLSSSRFPDQLPQQCHKHPAHPRMYIRMHVPDGLACRIENQNKISQC